MISKHKPCNTSTKEFKLEAIRLMDVPDRPASVLPATLSLMPAYRKIKPHRRPA